MAAYKAILFDLDDTLYDFSGNWEQALRKTFREHPLTSELDQPSVVEAFNRYSALHWSLVHGGTITFDQYRFKRLASALADYGIELGDEAFGNFNASFIDNNLQLIRPEESAIRQLARWAEHCRLGIITNGPADLAEEKVKRLGFQALIPAEHIVVSEKAGFFKPQPEIFRYGLDKLGVQSHEAVFVGDSWEDDVVGAVNAGITAIWLDKKGKTVPNNPDCQPLGIIRHISEAGQYL